MSQGSQTHSTRNPITASVTGLSRSTGTCYGVNVCGSCSQETDPNIIRI